MKTQTLLRSLVFTFCFSLFTLSLHSQWVSIPDTNFGNWLHTNGYYDTCLVGNSSIGWSMDTTCPAVVNATSVNCMLSNIRDLTGISYFDNLQILTCDGNQLSSLPVLPAGLTALRCTQNQLSSLPELPTGLTQLICVNNQLTTLPVLPTGLTDLDCRHNLLNRLPVLPGNLTSLSCNNNQLSHLPPLPDSLTSCSVSDNPLNCLPQLKRIGTFIFANTNITCLPNYGNVTISVPPLNTYPICDLLNNNGCEIYWNISGKVYADQNSNCLADNDESDLINVPVQLRSNGALLQQMPSLGSGTFSFDTDTGTYEISVDTTDLPFSVTCPANNIYYNTITPADSLHYSRNFALECKSGFDLAAWSIEGRFAPGITRKVDIHVGSASNFYGVDCVTGAGIGGQVIVEITGPASYVSPAAGSLTPHNVTGNVLTYNVADFGSIDFNKSFNIMVQTDTTAQIGQHVCFKVTVSSPFVDAIPINNVQTRCFVVRASIDPNNKEVYPISDIDTSQRWLTYTINFQNTGTDTAFHIYITDTLDTDLDVSSFQLLAYSHQPMVQIKQNHVRFNFPNINLPDSNTNEPLSHGYVQYKIKLKDNLPIGTAINNTAFIYFDFNAPVVTNTTTNTIALFSGIAASHEPLAVRIYPNPASGAVTISIDESMIGATATVTDITGRKISESKLEILNTKLETVRFASGVYFISVMDKEGRNAIKKLVIQK